MLLDCSSRNHASIMMASNTCLILELAATLKKKTHNVLTKISLKVVVDRSCNFIIIHSHF